MIENTKLTCILAIVKGLQCFEEVGINMFGFGDEDEFVEPNNSDTVQNLRVKVVRIRNYIERVVPGMTEKQFQQHFRLSRKTFEQLLPLIANELKRKSVKGRLPADPRRQLLSSLWILATPDSYRYVAKKFIFLLNHFIMVHIDLSFYTSNVNKDIGNTKAITINFFFFRSVAERFDMGKSSLSDAFIKIVKILCQIAPQVIKWPSHEEREQQQLLFKAMGGLDGVVGAVDGTFIPIKAPKEDPEAYRTRKCFYAMTLQAICNAGLKFTHCFVGFPGSVSDRRIFENSDIYRHVSQHEENWFSRNQYILGDKAYPLLHWCIPPYIDRGNLTPAQRNFNLRHAQTRSTIERCFSLLFGRLRRLKFLDMNRLDLIPDTIIAACVIHNLCLENDGLLNVEEYIQDGGQHPHDTNDHIFQTRSGNTSGNLFREYLCERLYE